MATLQTAQDVASPTSTGTSTGPEPAAQALAPRTVSGSGGYIYEQHPDGEIVIVGGPGTSGMRLTSGSAWEAITAEIGTFPAPPAMVVNPAPTPEVDVSPETQDEDFLDWVVDGATQLGQDVYTWMFGEGDSPLREAYDEVVQQIQGDATQVGEGGATQQVQGEAEAAALALAPEGTTREQTIAAYRTFLEARMVEVEALTGAARVQRVEALLAQCETVCASLNSGTMVDIAQLSTTPRAAGEAQANGFVPPDLIADIRPFIQMVEAPVTDAAESDAQVPGGSLYSAVDWNSRLGVPSYRSQTDNLVAGEATCNVTSTAMIYERLGISRAEVMAAVELEIKKDILQANGQAVTDEALEAMDLEPAQFEAAVESYLAAVNNDTANYRRVRGQATNATQRAEIADSYADGAQMEDLIDFLVHLRGSFRDRYSAVTAPDGLLGAVRPETTDRPTTEMLWAWNDANKALLTQTLAAGGAAAISIFHKNSRDNGTHIVSVQDYRNGQLTVDDPYGNLRDSYRVGGSVMGYQSGAATGRDLRNSRDAAFDNWEIEDAVELTDAESRGESSTWSDAQVSSIFRYMQLYRRA